MNESVDIVDLLNRKTRKNPETGCWDYLSLGTEGYGQIAIKGKSYFVHRLSANIFLNFDLDSKLWICHKCDNKKCWNPEHLFIGTPAKNAWDMVNKGRHRNQYSNATRCKHGHKFTEENTIWRKVGNCQTRRCKECQRISNIKGQAKMKRLVEERKLQYASK